jgi:adenylate cyclase
MPKRDLQRRGTKLVSAARGLNRQPTLLEAAKRTRERLLGDEQFIDRLSTARGRPADLATRELSTLRGDAPGVLGELGLTVLQAWQNLSENRGRGRGEVDVAIMFTDLVGFSSWSLQAGDDLTIALLRDVSDAIEPPILERRGEVVKRLGDGLMAAFWDASSATDAAFEACERLSAIDVSGYRPQLRTGIHLGRPRKIGGDYFGIDVNISARLAEAAEPGEIILSESAMRALGTLEVSAKERRVTAKGAPANLIAHAVERPLGVSVRP